MVHTVSGLVLHRLHRMMNAGDTPYEAQMVIGAMVDLVKEVDPMFFDKVGLATLESRACRNRRSRGRGPSGDAFARGVRRAAGQPRVAAARLVRRRRSAWSPTPCAPPSA